MFHYVPQNTTKSHSVKHCMVLRWSYSLNNNTLYFLKKCMTVNSIISLFSI